MGNRRDNPWLKLGRYLRFAVPCNRLDQRLAAMVVPGLRSAASRPVFGPRRREWRVGRGIYPDSLLPKNGNWFNAVEQIFPGLRSALPLRAAKIC
jgi:hypothetical protein